LLILGFNAIELFLLFTFIVMKKIFLSATLLLCFVTTFSQENIRWMRYPSISPDGTQIAFGYKGDIYLVSSQGGLATPITIHDSHDMMPVWSHDGKNIAFASDRFGNFDVFVMPLSGGKPVRVTAHSAADYPQDFSPDNSKVLFTSSRGISNTNVRFYSPRLFQNLYAVSIQGGKAKLISEAGMTEARYNTVNSGISQFALAPNGKEIAFVNRGEVFVTSVEGTQTKRITNTPQQERYVQWSPDGRSLIYSAERGESWDIYKATINRKEEPYFYASTILDEVALIASNEEEFQGKYSPDGKFIAYIAERNSLKVFNIETKESNTLLPIGRNFSYSDGDWDFAWSPDSKHILCDDGEGNWFSSSVALIKNENNSSIVHPLASGYGQGNVKWAMNGKAMTWVNAKNGRKSHAMQGNREVDIYLGFFDQAAYDRFSLSKEEFALLEEKEKKEKEAKEKEDKEDKENGIKKKKEKTDEKSDSTKQTPLVIEHFAERVKRLTINSSSISDYVLNNEGTKLYYLAAFEKGFDLWVTEPRTRETKILAKLGAGGSGIE
jgi:tricorn protease